MRVVQPERLTRVVKTRSLVPVGRKGRRMRGVTSKMSAAIRIDAEFLGKMTELGDLFADKAKRKGRTLHHIS